MRDGGKIHGDGDRAVLALHCGGARGAMWQPLAQALDPRFVVAAPDRIGFDGEKRRAAAPRPMTLAAEARVAIEQARMLGAPVHLIGHGSGASLALRAAFDAPEMFKSLVLVEPASFHLLRGSHPRDGRLFAQIAELAESVCIASSQDRSAEAAWCYVDYWNGEGAFPQQSTARRQQIMDDMARICVELWATMQDPLRIADLQRIGVPTVVVGAEDSPEPTRRIAELIATHLPLARLERLPGGHMLPLSDAPRLNRLISTHLRRAEKADTVAA